MAQIQVNPFILSDTTLKIAADNYETSVSSVEFQPSGGTVSWKGLSPAAVFTFPQSVTWACAIAFAQDWETEDSLSQYLFEHQGETVAIEFAPVRGGKSIYANIVIVPGSIGGAVDAVAASTVTLGVVGKPTFQAPTV